MSDAPQPLHSGWPGQAFAKNLAFRVEHAQADDVVGAVAPFSAPVHAAIVAPLRRGGEAIGTVVALRDSVDLPYSLREQQLVEQLMLDNAEAPAASTREPDAGRLVEHAAAGLWATDLDGVTTFVNEAVSETPELVNEDPYDAGWLVRVRLSEPSEKDQLLSAEAYRSQLTSED